MLVEVVVLAHPGLVAGKENTPQPKHCKGGTAQAAKQESSLPCPVIASITVAGIGCVIETGENQDSISVRSH